MKTLIVYDSLFGNTHRVASAIAAVFRGAGEVEMRRAAETASLDASGFDLVLVGGPTHHMGISETMEAVLEATPKGSLDGVPAAAFDTRYEMAPWLLRASGGSAAAKIARKLRRAGARSPVSPESFLIEHYHEGPLLEGEMEHAEAWAKTVLARVAETGAESGRPVPA